jgi:hypothetical protein
MDVDIDVIGPAVLLLMGCLALTALIPRQWRTAIPWWIPLARCGPLVGLGCACLIGGSGLNLLLRAVGRPLVPLWFYVPLVLGMGLLIADKLLNARRDFWRAVHGRAGRKRKPASSPGNRTTSNTVPPHEP